MVRDDSPAFISGRRAVSEPHSAVHSVGLGRKRPGSIRQQESIHRVHVRRSGRSRKKNQTNNTHRRPRRPEPRVLSAKHARMVFDQDGFLNAGGPILEKPHQTRQVTVRCPEGTNPGSQNDIYRDALGERRSCMGITDSSFTKQILVLSFILPIVSCGGGKSGTSGLSQVSIKLNQATATVVPGQTQQFTATVTGTDNTAVTWNVDNVSGGNPQHGTISTSGLSTE